MKLHHIMIFALALNAQQPSLQAMERVRGLYTTTAEIMKKNRSNRLVFVAAHDSLWLTKHFLWLGVNVNTQCTEASKCQHTSLAQAANNGNPAMVQLLLPCLRTSLAHAANNGNPVMVQLLLGKGAEVNVFNVSGDTPLMEAARKGCVGSVRALLGAGAWVDVENLHYETAISLAITGLHPQVVKILLEVGASIDGSIGSQLAFLSSFQLSGLLGEIGKLGETLEVMNNHKQTIANLINVQLAKREFCVVEEEQGKLDAVSKFVNIINECLWGDNLLGLMGRNDAAFGPVNSNFPSPNIQD